jgi:UDP-glucose 4-epimerase
MSMQLITGGLGFIGSHTARALLDLGEQCVITQHRTSRVPPFLRDEIGSKAFIEQVDVTDTKAFMELGKKYEITGIIHFAGILTPGGSGLSEDLRANMTGLANAFQAAFEWKVKRITIPSALGVYNGITCVPWREDQPLPCTAAYSIEAFKKADEVFSSYFQSASGITCINVRIAAIYGPGYSATRGSLVARLVHAAVRGAKPNLENIRGSIHAGDGGDWCHVGDCGRGIALLQTGKELHHRIYNVASGRPTRNGEILEAIGKIIPEFKAELPEGSDTRGPGSCLTLILHGFVKTQAMRPGSTWSRG